MGTLELQNLTYSYDKKKKVLRGIDARMEAGKMYAILGPSGCGKTTLLSLLGGLDSPTSGAMIGCRPRKNFWKDIRSRARLCRKSTSMMFRGSSTHWFRMGIRRLRSRRNTPC